jgi:ribosomal protein S12 methylthiotransferase
MIDRVEAGYFVGRTEFDSPDVDNEVLVDASKYYLRLGAFAELRITGASDFDLYGEPATAVK